MSKKRTIRRPGGQKPTAARERTAPTDTADAVRQVDGADEADASTPPAPARRRRGIAPRAETPPPPAPEPSVAEPLRGLAALASMDRSELEAALLSRTRTRRLEPGSEIEGTVTAIARDTIFVDIGGKAEGQLRRDEWRDELPAIGATVRAFVLSQSETGVRLSTRLTGPGASAYLQEAHESQIPVEGQITGANPGGFTVRIGDARAFCPISHLDTRPIEDPSEWVGQTLTFHIIEVGDKVVVSRRRILEAEAEARIADFWAEVKRGDVRDGVVVNVHDWGAFVDLDGVQGLVPRAELSWELVEDARQVVRRGQRVRVQIVEIDRDQQKLTLSIRATAPQESSETDGGDAGRSLGTFADLFAGLNKR